MKDYGSYRPRNIWKMDHNCTSSLLDILSFHLFIPKEHFLCLFGYYGRYGGMELGEVTYLDDSLQNSLSRLRNSENYLGQRQTFLRSVASCKGDWAICWTTPSFCMLRRWWTSLLPCIMVWEYSPAQSENHHYSQDRLTLEFHMQEMEVGGILLMYHLWVAFVL